jgi:hypothetical protein
LLIQKCQDFRGSKGIVSGIFEFVKFPTRYEWSGIFEFVKFPTRYEWFKIMGTVQQLIGDRRVYTQTLMFTTSYKNKSAAGL